MARWANAMHPSQVEFGNFFSLLVTGLLCIDFEGHTMTNKDFFPLVTAA